MSGIIQVEMLYVTTVGRNAFKIMYNRQEGLDGSQKHSFAEDDIT